MNPALKRIGEIAEPTLSFAWWAVVTFVWMWVAPWLLSGTVLGSAYMVDGVTGLRDLITSFATTDSISWLTFPEAWSVFQCVIGGAVLAWRVFRAPWTIRQLDLIGQVADDRVAEFFSRLQSRFPSLAPNSGLSGRNAIALACILGVIAITAMVLAWGPATHPTAQHQLPGSNALPPARIQPQRAQPHPEVALRLADGSIRSGRAEIRAMPDGSYSVSFK